VAGIVAITPAFDPGKATSRRDLADARRVAELVRRNGVEGFLEGLALVGDPLVEVAPNEVRKRMTLHRDLHALADALERIVRSRPFDSLADLSAIGVPALVVASRDKLDPGHPHDLAVAYHESLPHSELCCEPEGRAPLAWSRRKLGPRVLEFARKLGCP
jgi:hypothetical protein